MQRYTIHIFFYVSGTCSSSLIGHVNEKGRRVVGPKNIRPSAKTTDDSDSRNGFGRTDAQRLYDPPEFCGIM